MACDLATQTGSLLMAAIATPALSIKRFPTISLIDSLDSHGCAAIDAKSHASWLFFLILFPELGIVILLESIFFF